MKKVCLVLALLFISVFSFAQSTNKARLKTPVTPVSSVALPDAGLAEIGYCAIKVGETRNLAEMASGKNIQNWTSSTPSSVTVDADGNITGVSTGNAFIKINETEYIAVAVVPSDSFYVVAESQAALLPPDSVSSNETENLAEYRTEPTFRLAYRFNNKGEIKGASGANGGIDILGRGKNYEWLWTSFFQGGWFYDLNGTMREMTNGYQKDKNNGVELTLKPEFVYDNGVPYLQIRHFLHNPNKTAVTGQKFGASADIMMHQNDHAPLLYKPYGAYITDSETNPSIEIMFVGAEADGVTPVDTLWLGKWDGGEHVSHIYDDSRADVSDVDSAIGFSYQNIDLGTNETKEFIIRFTLSRSEQE
jgi:hypothetical protein